MISYNVLIFPILSFGLLIGLSYSFQPAPIWDSILFFIPWPVQYHLIFNLLHLRSPHNPDIPDMITDGRCGTLQLFLSLWKYDPFHIHHYGSVCSNQFRNKYMPSLAISSIFCYPVIDRFVYCLNGSCRSLGAFSFSSVSPSVDVNTNQISGTVCCVFPPTHIAFTLYSSAGLLPASAY